MTKDKDGLEEVFQGFGDASASMRLDPREMDEPEPWRSPCSPPRSIPAGDAYRFSMMVGRPIR